MENRDWLVFLNEEENRTNDIDLGIIYGQCNEHLRETDKKRDQILVFFVTVTGLYISNYDKLSSIVKIPNIILGSIVGLIGIVLSLILIEYRMWHLKYALAAIVLQKLMFYNVGKLNRELVNKMLEFQIKRPGHITKYMTFSEFRKVISQHIQRFGYEFRSIETLTLNAFLSVNTMNLVYVLNQYYCSWYFISTLIITNFLYFNIRNYRKLILVGREPKSFVINAELIWPLNLFPPREME